MRPVSTRLRRLGPGQSRPGFGLGLSCPQATAPASLGSPGQAPGARVQFGWGGRCSTKEGRPEAQTEEGELWRHKARGKGGCCPNGWAGCPLPVHAGAAPREGRAQKGRAEPVSQVTASGAAGVGKQPWQRTRVSHKPEG